VDADFKTPPAKDAAKPADTSAEISADKSTPKPAPAPGDDRHGIIAASNIAGLPALSVPCGFTKENLPIGIQFIADALGDDTCIGFARDFQKATEWHLRRPSGF
jgi:Asp-tRNA(Asn)/Glu-tRNA(Gln) amidotransferase A subunit family amidase